jgi:ubiquinone biosynthesis protein
MRYVAHTLRVFVLSLVFGARFVTRRRGTLDAGPELLLWYLQRCSGAFIKLGQLLAMRYDLLPISYCECLATLLDRLPPLPAGAIIAVMERDLRRPWSSAFREFDREPIGSASVAQVHRAILMDGTPVAVKVMRPGVEQQFQVDFRNIRLLAAILDALGVLGSIVASDLAGEFIQLTQQEFDFRREARNAQHLHELMQQGDLNHCAPAVYDELSGARVITMELLEGVWLHDLLAAVSNHDEQRLSAWAAQGIVPEQMGHLILRSILTQCYRYRFFHADPHAGNLVALPGGRLGYIDFGLVGWLDEQVWEQQFRLYESLANARIHAAYEAILSMMAPLPSAKLLRFEAETKALLQDWIMTINSAHSTASERSSGVFFLRLLDVVRRSGMSVPSGIMKLNRALIISDTAIMRLAPDMNRLAFLRAFFSDELRYLRDAGISAQLTSDAINHTLLEIMRGPNTAWSFLGWAAGQLPAIWRDSRQPPPKERKPAQAFPILARMALVGVMLFALVKVIGGATPLNRTYALIVSGLGDFGWPAVLLASASTIVLWWLLDVFSSREH